MQINQFMQKFRSAAQTPLMIFATYWSKIYTWFSEPVHQPSRIAIGLGLGLSPVGAWQA